MNDMQKKVRDFHIAMDLEWNDTPDMLDIYSKARRIELIREEFAEFRTALLNNKMLDVIDALGDLLYVVLGTAVELGVDMEPFFDEIHRSNMTKTGGHKRGDGKWIKPADYEPANLRKVWLYTYGEDDGTDK